MIKRFDFGLSRRFSRSKIHEIHFSGLQECSQAPTCTKNVNNVKKTKKITQDGRVEGGFEKQHVMTSFKLLPKKALTSSTKNNKCALIFGEVNRDFLT